MEVEVLLDRIYEYAVSIPWRDLVGAIGLFFGAISFRAYLDQRRENKNSKSLLDFVNRHVDKDISEDALKDLKDKLAEMEKQVDRELPILARRAVLKEQAEVHAKAISRHYRELKAIDSELRTEYCSDQIDDKIREKIVDRISPRYEKEWELNELRNKIAAICVLVAFSSVFFFPIGMIVCTLFAYPLFSASLRLLKLQGISIEIFRNAKFVILVCYVASCFGGAFFGWLMVDEVVESRQWLPYCIIIVCLLFLLFVFKINAWFDSRIRECQSS